VGRSVETNKDKQLDAEQLKFIVILSIPFVLLIALMVVLVFAKRIPSPTFLYNFIEKITSTAQCLFRQEFHKNHQTM
jgi:hypothetical protein